MAMEGLPPPTRGRSRSRSRSPPPRARMQSPRPTKRPPSPRGRRSRSRSRSPPRRRRRHDSDSYDSRSSSSYDSESRSPPRRSRRRRRSPSSSSYSSYSSRSRSPRRPRGSRIVRRRTRSRSRSRSRSPRYRWTREAYREEAIRMRRRMSPPKRRMRRREESTPRDLRTVFVWQLGQRVGEKDVADFFESAGRVRDVRMLRDRTSMKHKGGAYVEFYERESVARALRLGGKMLAGVAVAVKTSIDGGGMPKVVDDSMVGWSKRRPVRHVREGPKLVSIEELRRLLNPLGLPVPGVGVGKVEEEGFKRLYVGSVAFQLAEGDLRTIFEPFGSIVSLQLQRDATGRSRGYGFVEFATHEAAKKAMEIDGLSVAGRTLKVALASMEKGRDVTGELDEGKEGGVGMNASQRVMLMQQLSRGENLGKGDDKKMAVVEEESRTLMLSNMFDAKTEEPGFELELAEDVRDECQNSYGRVAHLHVEPESTGVVFIRFEELKDAVKARTGLNGRWFGGRKIVAAFVSEGEYLRRFPAAA